MDPSVHPKDRVTVAVRPISALTRVIIDATKYIGNPRTDLLFRREFAPVCYRTRDHEIGGWNK